MNHSDMMTGAPSSGRSHRSASNSCHQPQRWVVVTWKHRNVGGTSLASYVDDEQFVVATGPTPWGSGSWGPFPRSAITEIRPLADGDRWKHSGSWDSWWTASDLLDAYQRARRGTLRSAGEAEQTLAAAVGGAS